MNDYELTDLQEALFRQHLPFVRHLLAKLAPKLPPIVDLDDMEAAGRLGLLHAVKNFDPDVGKSFMAFSKKRIRGAMLDEIRSMDWIGRTYRSKALAPGSALPIMREFTCYSDPDSGRTIDPVCEDVSAEREIGAKEMVQWFMDRLPKREARIIWAYHGPESMTYLEIAAELDISEGRVSHLYHRAVKKMYYLAEKLPHDPCE